MGEWKIMQEVWMLKEMTNQTNKIRRSSGSWERRKTRWNVLKIKNLVCVLKWNRNTAFLMHWSAYNHAHQTLYPNDLAVYLNDLHLCYNSCFTQSAVLVLLLAPTEPATTDLSKQQVWIYTVLSMSSKEKMENIFLTRFFDLFLGYQSSPKS